MTRQKTCFLARKKKVTKLSLPLANLFFPNFYFTLPFIKTNQEKILMKYLNTILKFFCYLFRRGRRSKRGKSALPYFRLQARGAVIFFIYLPASIVAKEKPTCRLNIYDAVKCFITGFYLNFS